MQEYPLDPQIFRNLQTTTALFETPSFGELMENEKLITQNTVEEVF